MCGAGVSYDEVGIYRNVPPVIGAMVILLAFIVFTLAGLSVTR
jgi:hypothetical protein